MHEMSLQEKVICLAIAGRNPELPYQLNDIKCADGTVQQVYDIPAADKAKVFADLYPFADGLTIENEVFDLHERRLFKVCEFLVIRWGGANLLVSPYFQYTGGTLVDWMMPEKVSRQENVVDVRRASKRK